MPAVKIYIKAPVPPDKAKRKSKRKPDRDLASWLHRNHMNLVPPGVAVGVAGAAHLATLGPDALSMAWAPLGLAGVYAMAKTDVLADVLNRGRERAYVAAISASAGAWMSWATWMGQVPGALGLATLTGATVALGIPWWSHRRVRNSLPLEIADMPPKAQKVIRRAAERMVAGWYTAMQLAGTPTVGLTRIVATSQRFDFHVKLPGNMSREDFRRRVGTRRLETAMDLAKGAVRIVEPEEVDKTAPGRKRQAKARDVVIRVMLTDPFRDRDPIADPDHGGMARIGKSEVGEPIVIDMTRSALVAGQSGAGKTGLVHNMIRAATKIPWMAVIGVDAQEGAVEFGPWERAMVALARDVTQTERLLDAIQAEANRRGAIMAANGWRNWPCTPEDPHLKTFIDEFQIINRIKPVYVENVDGKKERQPTPGERVANMSRELRKYGFSFVVATQYPTKEGGLPPELKEQVFYSIGLRVKSGVADRAIFGEDAKDRGYTPSTLPSDQPGYFYIEGGEHTHPVICLTDDLPDSVLERVQREAAEVTVEVLRATVPAGAGGELVPVGVSPAPAGTRLEPEEDVVEAVLVEPTTNRDKVLYSVQSAPGVVHRGDIQKDWKMDQKTADKYLTLLQEEGLVVKVGPARYVKA
ncbi:FtsK/SpoIIIE domain-containing protein [Microbispora rosea]|uniref:FtsK/SpoIIIE domain-containing protein n=1 Tax=Microbispora rosea TaxID=58117 RepID=UPI0037B9DCC8